MHKRYFLQLGAVFLGTAFLSRYINGSSETMAVSKANHEFEVVKTEEEWKKTLTPEQFEILRKHGT